MQVKIVIQSRLASMRLPAKALLPVGNYPAVVLCAKRASTRGRPLVVATSTDPSDDLLVNELKKYAIPFVRGEQHNVLSRLVLATAEMSEKDIMVRLTADNLFPDGCLIEEVLDYFMTHQAEYLTTTFPQSHLPYGLSVEVFRVGLLREANQLASTECDKEHVTPWIARHTQKVEYYTPNVDKKYQVNLRHLRCTLDTFEDYTKLNPLFAEVGDPVHIGYQTLLAGLVQANAGSLIGFPLNISQKTAQSEFTLGTAQLGMTYGRANTRGMPSSEEASRIILRALCLGVTSIDTARAYGIAEERVGVALQGGKGSQVAVVTKLDPLEWADDLLPPKAMLAGVEASIYRSCTALKSSSLHTLLLHRWQHYHQHEGLIWQHLLKLKQEGVIQHLGVSVNTPVEAIEALQVPEMTHLQLPFNLLDRRWLDLGFQEALRQRSDVTVQVRSALLQGILGADQHCWPKIEKVDSENIIARLEHFVEKFSRKHRVDLCYAYVRSSPWVNSVVVGIDTIEQLDDNLNLFQQAPLLDWQAKELEAAVIDIPTKLLIPSMW